MEVSSRYSYFSNFVVNGSEICSGGATNYHYDYIGRGGNATRIDFEGGKSLKIDFLVLDFL